MRKSSEISVSVRDLVKRFRVYPTPAHMLYEFLLPRSSRKEFQALAGISFDVPKGEVVGIIGANGAGKSTLLKILAGTLDKTSGTISIDGRVGAILELGTGFHEDYSGRENIYMGGIVLGMSKDEIERKTEEIIEFSGIRKFIDQPFRTYSSGMRARLTFSLAISQSPEILIIDEALAAGDAIFVEKCLRKIKEICTGDTTVLFVSHSIQMLQLFCSKGIWLHEGKIVLDGDIDVVSKAYQRYVYEQSEEYLRSTTDSSSGFATAQDLIDRSGPKKGINSIDDEFFKYGNKRVRITKFEVLDSSGKDKRQFHSHEYVEFKIHYEGEWEDDFDLHASCQIFDSLASLIFTPSTVEDGTEFKPKSPCGTISFSFPDFLLGTGDYSLTPCLFLRRGSEEFWSDVHDRVYKIRVESTRYSYSYIAEMPVDVSCY